MKEHVLRSREFKGLATHVSEVSQTLELFQTDQGGSHEVHGVWGVRRGMEHTGFAKKDSAIAAIAGFETLNGNLSYVTVAGTSVYGEIG